MAGRRCRTYSTSVWRLISQTDRTTSCVKRRVLAGRSTSTTADSATEKGDPPRRSLRFSSKTGSRPHRAADDTPSARNKRCPAGTEH